MPVTIKVNGRHNSLVHKGSNHFSKATIPDVCKTPTPGGPVPIPYPNISFSSSLSKGTKTVKADGGNMIAIKGSEFSMSTGDEPGTVGGVKSNTFKKESTWITYSLNVKMEGKGACRLEDKKFQNHENTVDIMGAGGAPVSVQDLEEKLKEIAKCCNLAIDCKSKGNKPNCTERGRLKHQCCENAINSKNWSGNVGTEAHHPGKQICRLDVQIPAPPVPKSAVTNIFDFKFNCSKDPYMSDRQRRKYKRNFRNAEIKVVGERGAKKCPPKGCANAQNEC